MFNSPFQRSGPFPLRTLTRAAVQAVPAVRQARAAFVVPAAPVALAARAARVVPAVMPDSVARLGQRAWPTLERLVRKTVRLEQLVLMAPPETAVAVLTAETAPMAGPE